MNNRFLSVLFLCGSISADWPCFEASLGVGVQNDRAYLTGFDDSSGVRQKTVQNGFKNIWSTYGRGEVGMFWGPFQASYQADLGGGSSGHAQMSLNLSSPVTVPTYSAPISNNQIWNQVAMCGYAFGICKGLSVVPLIGWNQYQSKWKIGTSSPTTAPYTASLFGPTPILGQFSLSEKGSHITERFSGAFIGGELCLEMGCFDVAVGYRYSFGSFFNNYELFDFDFVVPSLAELNGQAAIRSVQCSGEGQFANAHLGYHLTRNWSLYLEGEGRWIQKTNGDINIVDSIHVMAGNQQQQQTQDQYAKFKARWISYAITLGTRFTF